MKIIILLVIPLIFMSTSCEKEDPEPAFRQGFSCKINGEEWIAKTPASVGGAVPIFVDYIESTGELYITGTKKDSDLNIFEKINIYALNIYSASSYKVKPLKGNGEESLGFGDIEDNSMCNAFYHDSLNPGTIKICVFDKEKRQMSGTFEMTLINRNCQDSLMEITDGQFAFKY